MKELREKLFRYKFSEIFKTNKDKTITPILDFYIKGIPVKKDSVKIKEGDVFLGLEFFKFKSKDFIIKEEEEKLTLLGWLDKNN